MKVNVKSIQPLRGWADVCSVNTALHAVLFVFNPFGIGGCYSYVYLKGMVGFNNATSSRFGLMVGYFL